ncbi:hypothetical protein F8388_015507 [Cannabis sativa]|uniref:RFTS domain-containing protein n=1 Tax=Cannabis sativa TaxID=3483 RepID=A0A7J6GKM4_CANSA|nr:hypothetical protein F8388_015507 [Cannabis sativa]
MVNTSADKIDEFIVFDSDLDLCYPNELSRSMLHNWSLYNSDLRLVSLELLPMKPCSDIDVTIYGSGVMIVDHGSGFCLDDDLDQPSSKSTEAHALYHFMLYYLCSIFYAIGFYLPLHYLAPNSPRLHNEINRVEHFTGPAKAQRLEVVFSFKSILKMLPQKSQTKHRDEVTAASKTRERLLITTTVIPPIATS